MTYRWLTLILLLSVCLYTFYCIYDIPNLLIILLIFLGYVVHLWIFSIVANLKFFSNVFMAKLHIIQWTPVFQTRVVEGVFLFWIGKWFGVK